MIHHTKRFQECFNHIHTFIGSKRHYNFCNFNIYQNDANILFLVAKSIEVTSCIILKLLIILTFSFIALIFNQNWRDNESYFWWLRKVFGSSFNFGAPNAEFLTNFCTFFHPWHLQGHPIKWWLKVKLKFLMCTWWPVISHFKVLHLYR